MVALRRAPRGALDYNTREAARAGAGEAVWASNKSNRRKETAGFQNPPPPPSSLALRGAGGVASGENRRTGGLASGPQASEAATRTGPDPDPKSVPIPEGVRALSGLPTRRRSLFTVG